MKDEFGDRMKGYEGVEAKRRLSGGPVCARIDGRSFSKFTKNFERPYDPIVAVAMGYACAVLVDKTKANIGFVQSDEISLVWDVPEEGSQMIFDGRVQKLTSVTASLASMAFASALIQQGCAEIVLNKLPHFDSRVWAVPSRVEAANTILWRSQDARKNGVSSAARAHMSAKQMHGLNQLEMIEAMKERGVDYHTAYPVPHRHGVYFKRQTVERTLSDKDWNSIPEPHRPPRDQLVTRTEIKELDIEYFGDVENRVGVIFDGEDPIIRA